MVTVQTVKFFLSGVYAFTWLVFVLVAIFVISTLHRRVFLVSILIQCMEHLGWYVTFVTIVIWFWCTGPLVFHMDPVHVMVKLWCVVCKNGLV